MNDMLAPLPTSLPRYRGEAPEHRYCQPLRVTQDQTIGQALALPAYGSLAALQWALAERLQASHVGVHLHIQGDEAFIWAMRSVAHEAGLLAEEITCTLKPNGARSIFCVHCSRVQAGSASDYHTCCGCGVLLEVRRHFSERLGANLGVCADADRPFGQPVCEEQP